MSGLDVGLIGCGHISTTHLKAWRKAGGPQVRGVYDVDPDTAAARARQFGIPEVFEDVDELVSACDVVDICTPPQTHHDLLTRALAASRHVIIEKPIVTDLAAWDALQERLAAARSALCVVHNLKYTHAVRRARRWIDEGRLGDVLHLDWRFMTSPAHDRMLVGTGHWSHDLPGGRWFETLPHNLYLTHYFAGPLELAGASVLHPSGSAPRMAADEVLVHLEGAGTLATLRFSARCTLNRRTLTITGSEGIVHIDLLANFATLSRVRDGKVARVLGTHLLESGLTAAQAVPDRVANAVRRLAGQTPHALLIDAFARHLRGEGDAPTPLEEVDYVVRHCDAIGREIDRRLA